ncbi:MAG: ABC transporter substrate-binding protein [Alphaproteobacteria bacterium]|jgi:peptide/nickel transport system substrate-binding protein|nr:ABC transporter substrate-binding protein [Alphaproteobacteria bacterium]MDP6254681.1 ABC transporter substrate-binding protein [Alphaproteobacteria bacterium]MDP7053272.1 ABC transporter substrate-binding protein [Alphaproteobacteria bacterium]MDP7228810.1 ABC transporter substrate-binding protein [Alphaproteobacteria bacterium]MDP7459060.1 ABC transporter substrate-binding protein [Alphaproteobacteria bacterium]|tara:strand:+ start:2014 stop:3501 length:1488 start_codon:yes stop_codon:yes gene_type:complete
MSIARKFSHALAVAAIAALPFGAEAAKNSVNIAMTLEPPGLDPRANASAAIGQIALYNIYENLTRINQDATVSPMLAKSWSVSDDGLVYTFDLVQGVKFHDGTDFDSADVKYTFEANAAEGSKIKRKKRFVNMAKIETPDAHTVRITLKKPRPTFLFWMGEATAVIVGKESAAANATKPVGTGPFKFVRWVKGDSVLMEKNAGHRDAGSVKLAKVKFRFINDQAAQIAAMMSGDLDLIPFSRAAESLGPLKANPDVAVTFGTTEGETILSTNNKHPALSKLKVRQAIAHAIDRKEIIDGAMFGAGTPIGSHFAPHNPDYLDLTGTYPLDRAKSKALLAEAGYGGGLALSLKLPPTGYARDGGQIVAQQLNKAGFKITIENVEWPVWLKQVYKQKTYDLSIVSHVEPMDIGIYARPGYYFQYENKDFQDIMAKADGARDPAMRSKYLKMAQKKLAADAVNGYLFQLAKTTVRKKNLMGVWTSSPMFVNDMRVVYWK